MPDCYPWFHAIYAPLLAEAWTKRIVPSGCATNSIGNVDCSPESMRASAQDWLASNFPQVLDQLRGTLSLDTYTIARYLYSEVGVRTVEEAVAVAEAAMNKSKGKPQNLLLYRQAPGHPNRGFYGPIHGVGTGTSTWPYGRWAATSQDPSIMAILLAGLVTSGASGNFSNDADDQDGPEHWISKGQTALTNYVKGLANEGKFWVGPLPGVDHWHTFLQFTPDFVQRAREGKMLLARGIEALTLPAQRPYWPADLPICSKPGAIASFIQKSNGGAFLLASLGLAVGTGLASLVAKRYLHPR
jgi:hypothetical protein